MTFRPLAPDEVPQVVPFGAAFFAEANLPGTFDGGVFGPTWEKLVKSGLAEVMGAWEGDRLAGVAAFLVAPDTNTGDIIATEAFFYVEPADRGCGFALLDAAEASLGSRGTVKRILMIHLQHNARAMERAYRRKGYTPLEHVYVKELA